MKPYRIIAGTLLAGLVVVGALARVANSSDAPVASPDLSAVAQLGQRLFFDPGLSVSGQQSCASCHDPQNHYAPSNDLPVQLGGKDLRDPGIRNVPTLAYASFTPPFGVNMAKPGTENDGPPAPPQPPVTGQSWVPKGGLFHDGRVDTLQDQAEGVLFSPFEMANTDPARLAKYVRAGYGAEMEHLFGIGIRNDDQLLLAEAEYALARYQVEDVSFHPFSSKYDAYLAGRVKLSPAEERGLAVFEDPKRGNCAQCHPSRPDARGNPPLFTDFEYEALAVPRNMKIPANADPAFHDLGLCGPLRDDVVAGWPRACGRFKTPSLRNVATRHRFFHNGIYASLQQVMDFYARRDTRPDAFYSRDSKGQVRVYDDLPPQYHGNVDRMDVPFTRRRGESPALSAQEQADLIAFLQTLTDR